MSCLRVSALLATFLAAVPAWSQDLSGTWVAKVARAEEAAPTLITIELTVDGEDLKGTVAVGDRPPDEIVDGKLISDSITFTLPWENRLGGAPGAFISYQGKLSGEGLQFVSTFTVPGRDPVVAEFLAIREQSTK